MADFWNFTVPDVNFSQGVSSAVSGGGGPGTPQAAVPSQVSNWAQTLLGAANIFYNDRQSQRALQQAKLE